MYPPYPLASVLEYLPRSQLIEAINRGEATPVNLTTVRRINELVERLSGAIPENGEAINRTALNRLLLSPATGWHFRDLDALTVRQVIETLEALEPVAPSAIVPVEPAASNGNDLMRAVVAVGGDVAGQILSIAHDDSITAEQRIEAIFALDRTRLAWSSQQWAELVRCSRQNVEKMHWWRVTKSELERDFR